MQTGAAPPQGKRHALLSRGLLLAAFAFSALGLAGCFDDTNAPPPNTPMDPALLGMWEMAEGGSGKLDPFFVLVERSSDSQHFQVTQWMWDSKDSKFQYQTNKYLIHAVLLNGQSFLCVQLKSEDFQPSVEKEDKNDAGSDDRIGGYVFEAMNFTENNSVVELNAVTPKKDTVGDILESFREYKPSNTRIRWLKSDLTTFPTPETWGDVGVSVTSNYQDGCLVSGLVKGAVADLAGLKVGDVVTAIDGVAVKGMTIDNIADKLMGKPGSKVTLDVERSKPDVKFTLGLFRQQMSTNFTPSLPGLKVPAPVSFYLMHWKGLFGSGSLLALPIAAGLWFSLRRRAARDNAGQVQPSAIEASAMDAVRLTPEQPWPGLASFRQEDAGFFFGRGVETQELFRLVKSDPLTLLFGKSGLGKSSLISAGLFPILDKKGYRPVYLRFDHADEAPSLSTQFQKAVSTSGTLRPDQSTLWEFFHQVLPENPSSDSFSPVIVIDQFEEIFTLGKETVARSRRSAEFFHELADLVLNNCPDQVQKRFEENREAMRGYNFDAAHFRVVLSMREEYLAFLEEAHQPLRQITQQRLRLTEMSGARALEAITMAGKLILDASVAEDIVRYVAGSSNVTSAEQADLKDLEVTPALLSLICSELNNFRQRNELDHISGTLVAGTKDQILSDFYESCFEGLELGLRRFVEDQLITSTGFRDSMALEDALTFHGVTTSGLQTLASRRLLRLDRRAGTTRLEITHDLLVGACRTSRDRRVARGKSFIGRLSSLGAMVGKLIVIILATISTPMALAFWAVLIGMAFKLGKGDKPGVTFLFALGLSAAAIGFIFLAAAPLRRATWIGRFLVALGFTGGGFFMALLSVSSLLTSKADVSLNVSFLATVILCLFLPAMLQGIYLVSIFGDVFGLKARGIRRVRR
jgi:hypothetical protein